MAVEKTLGQKEVSGTAYPYAPLYLLPFTWLVVAVEYYNLVSIMAVFNVLIAMMLLSYLAVRITIDWLVRIAIVCTFAMAHAVEVPIFLGQNFLINLLFTAGFVIFDLQRRRALAIICFMLASITKPWGVLLVLIPFFKRDYRTVSLALLSVVILFGAQYLWEPDLVRGYIDQTRRHQSVSILAHNNVSFAAALHRLSLVGNGSTWQSWQRWNHSGEAPFGFFRYGLALSVILIGWIAKSDSLKVQSALVATFLLANVYWDFYAVLLVPLVLSTLLSLKTTTEESIARGYGIASVYILALFIGSNYRPWLGPWSQLEPFIIEIAAPDTLKSVGVLLIAILAAISAFPRHRFTAFVLILGIIMTYSIPSLFLFQVTDYVMRDSLSEHNVTMANAFVTFIPSVVFLSCFAVEAAREKVFEADWYQRLRAIS
jgi:hypothetical protein